MLKFTCDPSQACKKFIYLSLFVIASMTAAAQTEKQNLHLEKDERVEKFIISKDLHTPSLIRIKDGNKVLVKDVVTTLKQLLQADANTNFVTASSTPNNNGIVVNKYQQFYKNIKVQHGVYTAIATADKVEAFTGEYYDLKNINILPSITEKQALEFAKKYVNAKSYAWEQAKEARDITTDLLRKQLLNAAYEKLLPVGEVVIVKDVDGNGVDLSYKFDIYAGAPMSRAYVYVNAHTGKIMLYDRIIKHLSPDQKNISEHNGIVPEVAFILSGAADLMSAPPLPGDTATVPILTRYAGIKLMGTTSVSGIANDPSGNGMRIVNSTNGGLPFINGENPWTLNDKRFHGINSSQSEQTYSLNGIGGLPISVPVYNVARSFTDTSNTWPSALHKRSGATGNNEGNNDDFAFDAHWGAGVVKQYWKNIHGRASYDNQNSSIKSYIHSGQEYDNAFWNGSVMTYGDGSYQNGVRGGFAPLTSLDVCGHEIGHGVCSNTANLVYAGESGAMNEGYSDVWAAMIEHYALLSDPTLLASSSNNNGLSVWEIGEQIDARDTIPGGIRPNLKNYGTNDVQHTALRYMGNPNRAGDPAFYAEGPTIPGSTARKWKNPNCTGGPTLANDQCGVHSNSGVLNKLVYNLVLGNIGVTNTVDSENVRGNGIAYAVTNGEAFNVTGIGFEKTQRIMYLAEQSIPANAKFVDERNAAVLAAEILFGKCSFEWKQTIVAFHSVAIGKSSDTSLCSTLPKFTVALSKSVVSEYAPKSASNCTDSWTNVTLAYSILPPGNPLPINVTVTPTGTADINKDYTISPSTITYAANETGLKTTTISIYNDAEVENTETIVLAIHATDGLLIPLFVKDTTVTISILDDDNAPVIGSGRVNLMNENFDKVMGNGLPAGWNVIDKLGANKSTITWITGTLAAQYGFPTTAAYVTLKATPPATSAPNYDQANPGEILLSTSLIDATGKTNLKVNFTWAAQGEPNGNSTTSTQDFGTIIYSLDGINFMPFQFAGKEYNFTPKATSDSFFLPSILNNKKFYLGFDWYADANIAALPPFIIDNVVVSGGTQQIEKTSTYSVSETQYANKDLYYLSAQNGQVLAHVFNNSADLGCVTTIISEAGEGTAVNINYNGSVYQRAKRVVKITPSAVGKGITYNLTLYATVAELTGLSPSALHILKIKDGTPTTGTLLPENVVELTPVFGDFSSNGYYTYTANGVTGFSQFVMAVNSSVLPQKLLSFIAVPQNNEFIKISWTTTNEGLGTHTLERAVKGSLDFKSVSQQAMINGNGINEYFYDDKNVVENVVYQYRLKSSHNSSVVYSPIRQASISKKDSYIDIAPNPSKGMFTITIKGSTEISDMVVYNTAGQELFKSTKMLNKNTPVFIDLTNQPAGIYSLKIKLKGQTEVYKLIVQ